MTVLHNFNNTLGEHILQTARCHSERSALWANNQTYTYQALLQSAQQLAAVIQASHIESDTIAIYSYRSSWAYISMLATLFAGKTYVPMNPKFPVERNKKITLQAKARIFCIDKRCESQAKEWIQDLSSPALILFPEHDSIPEWCTSHKKHRYLCNSDLPETSAWKPPNKISEDDYAYLLFTSGTTGEPKGIAVSHKNVMAYLHHMKAAWPLQPEDRCTQIYDQTFDVSVHDIFTCWQSGACLYVVPEAVLLCPTGFIEKHQLTCWGSVPSMLGFIKRFGKLTPNALPSIKHSFFCGEALPTDMTAEWAKACPNSRIINLFGPTEATIAITASEWNRNTPPTTPIVPIGFPFTGQEIAIVNEQGELVQPGEKGSLLLAGSQLVSGYWKNTEKTAEQFIHKVIPGKSATRWYLTGDLASDDQNTGLLFHGRKDFQVKINGYRVELEEIAGTLRENFPCTWAIAIPWPVNSSTGTASGVVVWMSGKQQENITEQELKRFCASRLPAYMIPSHIFWTDELPRNNSGKIDINTLQRMTQEFMEKKAR